MGNNASRNRNRRDESAAPPPAYPPPSVSVYNANQPGGVPPQQFYGQQRPPAPPPPFNNAYFPGWRPPYPPPHPQYGPPANAFVPPRGGPPGPPAGPPQAGGGGRGAPPAPPPQQYFDQTRTIRNAVNLHKKTIQLTPVPGEPRKLCITFAFDATDACVVSTMVNATEDENNGNRLKAGKQAFSPSIHYPVPGLKLPFPKSDATAAEKHIVDLSLFDEEELTTVKTSEVPEGSDRRPLVTYPLVIRMECLGEAAQKDGHTLAKLKPGAPQQPWVQAQTTFAVLARDEHKQWQVRALKQKLLVDTVNYEIQDIYGLEQSHAPREDLTEEENEDRLCVICLVNERNTTVLPCRHMCMCDECAQELRKQTHKCPICRIHVESLLHIKRYDDGGGNQKTTERVIPVNPNAEVQEITRTAADTGLGVPATAPAPSRGSALMAATS